MVAVSAEGSTVYVLIRRLNSSCSRSIAFVVSRASPLARWQLRKTEQSIAGFLQAVGDRAVLEPPLANERLAARCDLFQRGRIDHVGIVGADFIMQTLGACASRLRCL